MRCVAGVAISISIPCLVATGATDLDVRLSGSGSARAWMKVFHDTPHFHPGPGVMKTTFYTHTTQLFELDHPDTHSLHYSLVQ